MTWVGSKTMTSASVPTSMASPYMAPRCHLWSLLVEMENYMSPVPLGGSKAMHEFLILHYMATDSAEAWDNFLDQCLPHCSWERAGSRRALALHMFDKCHIAPSHRRLAHPSWVASMKLMLDLLLGAGQKLYLCSRPFRNVPAQVYVRGFSAGSHSGICLLHILWSMPHVQVGQVGGILGGIAFPPVLLHGIPPEHGSQLMLIHLTTHRLCQWHPADDTLRSLPCKYCVVDWDTLELRWYLWAFLWSLDWPWHATWWISSMAAIAGATCGCTPPMSWHCPSEVSFLALLCSSESGPTGPQPAYNPFWWCYTGAIQWGYCYRTPAVRSCCKWGALLGYDTGCIDLWSHHWQPYLPTEEVGCLMVSFLQRLPLPRLVHFLDMILP